MAGLKVGDNVRLGAKVYRVPPLQTHERVFLDLDDFAWSVDDSARLIQSSPRGQPRQPNGPEGPAMSSRIEIDTIWVQPSLGLSKGMSVTVEGKVTLIRGSTATVEIEGYDKPVVGAAVAIKQV